MSNSTHTKQDTALATRQQGFPQSRLVAFQDGTLVNGYCPECGLCCGPQPETEPFPMALVDAQISHRTPEDFYLLDAHTVSLDQRGCKAFAPGGCRLPRKLRPVACNIFPLVLIQGKLYAYTNCPAVQLLPETELFALGRAAQDWLNTLSRADIQRIAISRSQEELAAKYRDLHLPVQGV